ncbi:MAG TPA: hypothetical protein VFI20_11540 [Terracidiphilus sp.]|nr:hypothetical protein [Terracidiphilus sp.]
MAIDFRRVRYKELKSPQKEAYNFQKISALLADFGYSTIRLSDDWNGADFIAQHHDGNVFLKVQLKSRLTFSKKYKDKELMVCFRVGEKWFLYPHDELLEKVIAEGLMEGTKSWDERGGYHFPQLSKRLKELLEPYRVPSTLE